MLPAYEAHNNTKHLVDYLSGVRDVEQCVSHQARMLDNTLLDSARQSRPIYNTTNHTIIRPAYRALSGASALVYGAMMEEVGAD